MNDGYRYEEVDGARYAVPIAPKPRKKEPPLTVVMNDNCSACSGSPMCMTVCPVDCIHIMYDGNMRPERVYVDYDTCIGCLNCFSFEVRPKHVNKGDRRENLDRFNDMDLMSKKGVCPWDAIEIHEFAAGVEKSTEFYRQPGKAAPAAVTKG